jgi:hypothetical protein
MVPALALTIIGGIVVGDHGIATRLPPWLGGNLGSIWTAVTTAMVLGLAVGIRLLRGDRRLVLFLRRFGHTGATHAATIATASIGGRWRLVTLDDAQIAPVGVGTMSEVVSAFSSGGTRFRAIWSVAGGLIGTVLVFVVLAAIGDVLYAATKGDVSTVFDRNSGTTAASILHVLLITGAAAAALGLVGVALSAVRLVLLPVTMFGVSLARAVRDAEGAKALTVPDPHGIVTARDRAKRLSRKVFSPRLIVLRVDSTIWQQAVNGVASVADVPLIDVSEPSGNVFWEIEQLAARFGPRCVFVGEYARVVHLADPVAAGPETQHIRRVLDGCTVLAYTTDDAGTKRFARALRIMLEQSIRTPLAGPRMPDALPRELVIEARRNATRARRRARHRRGSGNEARPADI